jgi:hypothetical protein
VRGRTARSRRPSSVARSADARIVRAGARHGFTVDQEAVARPVVDEFLTRFLK